MAHSRQAGKPQVKVGRILVPTDFSPGAEPALRWAAALAEAFGAEIIMLHGRTGRSHMFFGSVAEHVVRHSHVPVLTARQEDVAQ